MIAIANAEDLLGRNNRQNRHWLNKRGKKVGKIAWHRIRSAKRFN